MNIEDLTKPQLLLYWMAFHSIMHDTLCIEDCDVLVKNKAFKDKKSISNALYQLHKNGHIAKCNTAFNDVFWRITDAGKEYLVSIVSKLEKCTGQKKTEWTDANFGITPEVRAYIDKLEARIKELEAENARLNQDLKNADAALKNANLAIMMREDQLLDVQQRCALFEQECDRLHAELQALNAQKACTTEVSRYAAEAFENATEAFKHAAEAFKHLA